jgi:hypothetical protein
LEDVDLVDMVSDTPFEQRARVRLNRKYDLRSIFYGAGAAVDDHGLAAHIEQAIANRRALTDSQHAQIAPPTHTPDTPTQVAA